MKFTNKHNLPQAVVDAVNYTNQEPPALDHLTMTRLIDSPRIRMLTLDHYCEIEEDSSDRLFALLGTAVHAILSWSDKDALTEQRLVTEIQGWTVSGQYDRLSLQEKTLQDYKVSSVYSVAYGVKPAWEAQLNGLRYLAAKQGYVIETLEVVAILRDWSASQLYKDDYPKAPVVRLPIRLWTLDETERYLNERVRLHREAAYGSSLPACTEEERWSKSASYAVRKPTRKTAIRVFNNRAEAEALLANETPQAYIEERPGESIRCARGYCAVAKYCDQYQSSLKSDPVLKVA